MVETFLPERQVQTVAIPSDRDGDSELWLLRSGSHHYWDRTRPKMYKQACVCLFKPHPSQQSLVKAPGTPWVIQHFQSPITCHIFPQGCCSDTEVTCSQRGHPIPGNMGVFSLAKATGPTQITEALAGQ